MRRDIETKEMRDRLTICVENDTQHSLTATLRRLLRDPIRPRTDNGGFRISPILLLLALLAAFSIVSFVSFSLVRP
jgi:hypothetical protein